MFAKLVCDLYTYPMFNEYRDKKNSNDFFKFLSKTLSSSLLSEKTSKTSSNIFCDIFQLFN